MQSSPLGKYIYSLDGLDENWRQVLHDNDTTHYGANANV